MKKSNFLGYVAGTAIGLAAMFSPTKDQDTIDNKVLSNLKPANQQEQVMDKSYMPDLSSIVGAGNVYAGEKSEIEQAKAKCSEETGQDNCIYVDDYYKLAEPVDDPDMPEGLRKMPFYGRGIDGDNTEIETKAKRAPSNTLDGKFTNLYFSDKLHEPLNKIFAKEGYDVEKIYEFLSVNRNEKKIGFYRDGFMLLFNEDEEYCYILPFSKKAINEVFN